MAELSGALSDEGGGGWVETSLECAYRNATDRMVILRCLGPSSFFLERVVFPFELLCFSCPLESEVEIFTHSLGGPELLESMPARLLRLEASITSMDGALAPPSDDPNSEVEVRGGDGPWLQAG